MMIKGWRYHWKLGREFGFPVCCIVTFILDLGAKSCRSRGIRFTRMGQEYAPCGIFHRCHRTWQEQIRVGDLFLHMEHGDKIIRVGESQWALLD